MGEVGVSEEARLALLEFYLTVGGSENRKRRERGEEGGDRGEISLIPGWLGAFNFF